MKKGLSLGLIGLLVFSTLSILASMPVFAETVDEYFVYSWFDPPGISDVVAAGGYVEYYGVPEWGDEIQYVYFLSGNIGYKVKVWVTDGDGDGKIEPRQHPNHYLSEYQGPIEPRHFQIVSSKDLTGYTYGSGGHTEEFYVDSSGVYLGAYPYGINKWDHDWNYIGKIANSPPEGCESMAYNPAESIWYAGGRYRTIYQLKDTDGDGSFLDESWQAIFTYPNYGGDHHDGMEYVGGYLWISDMTSDVIGKWQYNPFTGVWQELERFTYTEPEDVEGMGFGPNDHFWVGSGWGDGSYLYELGNEITKGYPIADAGPDVLNHPPTVPIKFDASGSHHTDPTKQIVLYERDFESDGTWDYSGTDLIVEYTYPAYYYVPYFSQRDPTWADELLGGDGPTISSAGCALTSAAMVMAYYGVDTDPKRLNELIGRSGYDANYYIYWSVVAEKCHTDQNQIEYEGKIEPYSSEEVNNQLDAGWPVIVEVGGHFVVIIGREGDTYYINDPWDKDIKTLDHYPTRTGLRIFSGIPRSIDWDKTAKAYTATLRVTDNSDPPLQTSDTRIVHITAPPWKPVADPGGPYEGYVKAPVQLDGSKSYDPESTMFPPDHPWYETIATYDWDLDHDGQFDDATGAKPTYTWNNEGLYIIGLKVTDSQPNGPGGTVGPLDVDIKYTTVVVKIVQPPWRGVEVSISPEYQENLPGETLEYEVTVTNTGTVGDTFDLTVIDTMNWGPKLSESLLSVPAGEDKQTSLSVTMPKNALPNTEDEITVTAASTENAEVRDNDNCIARISLILLIERYFPVLKFSKGEEYYPCSFYFDGDNYINNNRANYDKGEGIWNKFYAYVHTAVDEEKFGIQYWFYYAYDKGSPGLWGISSHLHDWEPIIVVFDKSDFSKPAEVGWGRHGYIGGRGGRTREYESYEFAEKLPGYETHPVSYVALWKHSNYARPPSDYLSWTKGDEWWEGGDYLYPENFNWYLVDGCTGEHREQTREILSLPPLIFIEFIERFCRMNAELCTENPQPEPADGYWPWKFHDLALWHQDCWDSPRPNPSPLLWYGVIWRCPIDVHIYDAENRHVGVNYETREFENQIPNVTLSIDSERHQYLTILDPSENYRIEVVGIENGKYHFSWAYWENGEPVYWEFKENIPITEGEIHVLILNPLTSPKSLKTRSLQKLMEVGADKGILKYLEKSLNADLWEDPTHLVSKHGHKVFSVEKKAVKKLMKEMNKKDFPLELVDDFEGAITMLLDADRILAQTAIDDTITEEGDPKLIEKAEKEMMKAQEKWDEGKYDKSIDHYKKAWKHAQKALKHAPDSKEPHFSLFIPSVHLMMELPGIKGQWPYAPS